MDLKALRFRVFAANPENGDAKRQCTFAHYTSIACKQKQESRWTRKQYYKSQRDICWEKQRSVSYGRV